MFEPPEKIPDIPPMSHATGNRLLAGLAATSGFLGLLGLALELSTERWLAKLLGIAPLFISAPMGVAAVILTAVIVFRINPRTAIFPGVLSILFWVFFVVFQ